MRIVALLVAAAGFLLSMATAQAEQFLVWHNNSRMEVVIDGPSGGGVSPMNIYYRVPRPGMRQEGVEAGTLLFNGRVTWRTGLIEGQARIFKAGCAPLTYSVTGTFVRGSSFELIGAAPSHRPGSCGVGQVAINHNSTLLFTP